MLIRRLTDKPWSFEGPLAQTRTCVCVCLVYVCHVNFDLIRSLSDADVHDINVPIKTRKCQAQILHTSIESE